MQPMSNGFVLGFNAAEDTIDCIRSLQLQIDLVYVDNGSDVDQFEMVRQAFPDLLCLRSERNLGFARAYNAGLRYCLHAGADLILTANNDLVFDPDAVSRMLTHLSGHATCGLVTPRITYHHAPERVWSAGLRRRRFPPAVVHNKTAREDAGAFRFSTPVKLTTLCTAMLRAAAVREIGLLDPSFRFYGEDIDYSLRMQEQGWEIYYLADAGVLHKSPEIGGGDRRGRTDFWKTCGRSEALLDRKHPELFPGWQRWLHRRYLSARSLAEGGWSGRRAFQAGVREGVGVELEAVPAWDSEEGEVFELIGKQ